MVCPGVTDVRRQPQVVPQVDELVDVDESADVVVGAFAQYDLVDPGPLTPVGLDPSGSEGHSNSHVGAVR